MRLVLASSSPRRAELLANLGLEFTVTAIEIDETRRPDESAALYVERLAREKATVAASLAIGETEGPERLIVAGDTAVVHDGHVMGKPAHPEEARSMLRRLQGKAHEVFTGMAVTHEGRMESLVDVTEVRMLAMTDDEITDYVASGEPMDKAGAYALQGRGGLYVESISGSPFTVIGLPVHLLPRLVARVGGRLDQFLRPSSL
ncbi:MAG TPA: Maf family protein [Acidimicrobiia bacterium]